MSNGSGVRWAECLLIIGTGCRVQVFSLILDSSVGLSAGIQSAEDWVSETPWVRILLSAEEDNLSPFDSKIACLCQSIEINNNKYVYRQSQVRMSNGSGVRWAECLLIIGTGCRVQVFSLILDSSVGLSAGIQSAEDWVSETPRVRILLSAEEDNLSPFDSKIACLCQSIEINNNKYVYRQSQVRMSNGSGVRWAECLLIIGTGCRVQVFSLILDSSVGMSAGIQSAEYWVSETPWVRILLSAEEDNLSPFDSKIACLCQSIEINNNKYVPIIVSSLFPVITNDQSKVHAKVQGQRSKVKVTKVTTQLNRVRTVIPVWIHILLWNYANNLMLHRREVILFFQGHPLNFNVTRLKFVEFDPDWEFPDCNSSLNSPMAMKWCTMLEVTLKRFLIVFQGHPSNCKVTRL